MIVAWEDALAVLAAIAATDDATLREGVLFLGRGRPAQLGIELDADVVHEALLALHDVGYVDWLDLSYSSGGATVEGLLVTGRGMQALGQWPMLHTVMTPRSLAHLLEALAPYAADPAKGATLERAADRARQWGAGTLQHSVVSLGAAALRARYGIG